MLSSSQIKDTFDSYDKDKSGKLSLDEVVKLSTQLGITVTKPELDALFKSIDTDNDGNLSFEEFLAWYRVGKNNKIALNLKNQIEAKKAMQFMSLSGAPGDQR